MKTEITLPKNIKVGHAQNEYTGVTVILAPKGAIGGADVRGGAPGTRETDLLRPEKMMEKINAVVLAGGSAYGLAAADGVMDYCRENGIGFSTGKKVVPIVTGAVIYDLNDKEYHYPTPQMGAEACANTNDKLTFGQVGAGVGATVGKVRGLKNCSKGGIGAATVKTAGVNVTAIMCVNAFGDVWEDGKIIAGAHSADGGFIDTNKCLLEGRFLDLVIGSNTTIGCVITDAKLDKVQCNKLAAIAHNGLARTIRPVHTDYDGDSIFALSSGCRPVLNFALLQIAAVEAVENAVLNAVKSGIGYKIEYTEE